MSQKNIIALDVMGGDFGPQAVIPAAAISKETTTDLYFLLYGDESKIKPVLDQYSALRNSVDICHTDKFISSDDKPSNALRRGKESSMRLAINAVKEKDADAVVSAGNTGALMAMAKMVLKCLPGIHRPAIASVFPSKRRDTVMLDLGANLSCDAEILVQFALLGTVYARVVMGVNSPSVGILNIGSEEMKGHDQLRAAASILNNVDFSGSFYGFIEGDDIPKGTTDVTVTDGFTGNVALKVSEGVADLTGHLFRDAFKSSILGTLGALLASGAIKRLKKKIDPRLYNGGMFLGLNGICVKSHGGMDEYGFSRAILVASDLVKQGYNERVAQELEKLMNQESFFSQMPGVAS